MADLPGMRSINMLRNVVYVLLIIFFIVASVAAYAVISTVNKADEAVVQPIGDLVRQLVLPATPVILPDKTTIVLEINNLTRLETASIELEKVITAERDQELLWGAMGETMVFVAYGTVYAGVDFAQMTTDDLQVVSPDTVWIHLPEAQYFDDIPALNTERSFVADRDTGLLTKGDPELETEVRQVAEATLREEAMSSNVLQVANDNARQFMQDFLQGLGFENIEFWDETPPPAPPYEQEVPKGFAVTPAP
jgi:regulator of protease activity HflC (stomatin/prohibitin superfamily)